MSRFTADSNERSGVIFRHSADTALALPNAVPLAEINLPSSIYSTPIVANNVLDIATKRLCRIKFREI